jgi:hypothetical protein
MAIQGCKGSETHIIQMFSCLMYVYLGWTVKCSQSTRVWWQLQCAHTASSTAAAIILLQRNAAARLGNNYVDTYVTKLHRILWFSLTDCLLCCVAAPPDATLHMTVDYV